MADSRRSFVASLMALPALAAVPEPEQVSKIEHGNEVGYVMEYDGRIRDEDMRRIKEQWNNIFGPNSPKLIILSEGLKLKRLQL